MPDGFRFAVKLPKAITHTKRLSFEAEPLICSTGFVAEIAALGDRLAF